MNARSGLTVGGQPGEARRQVAEIPIVPRAESALRRRRDCLHGQRVAQEAQLAHAAARESRAEPYRATEAQVLAARLAGTRLLLAEVDAALARFREGTYGYCASCREAIPRARLEVMPYVRYCIDCQRCS